MAFVFSIKESGDRREIPLFPESIKTAARLAPLTLWQGLPSLYFYLAWPATGGKAGALPLAVSSVEVSISLTHWVYFLSLPPPSMQGLYPFSCV